MSKPVWIISIKFVGLMASSVLAVMSIKLHIITNFKGEIVAAQLTTGNVHDTKPVRELATGLITNVRKNMKAKALSLWVRAMLSRRFIIETINDQLKNISQIEHSRHRSANGFMLNLLGGLVAYCLKENKRTLNISDLELNTIVKA